MPRTSGNKTIILIGCDLHMERSIVEIERCVIRPHIVTLDSFVWQTEPYFTETTFNTVHFDTAMANEKI